MANFRRLPAPITDAWNWQLEGHCRGLETSVFFHPDGERGPARARREARAKAICCGCPVIEPCRAWALAVQEPYGIWGGLSEHERNAILGKTKSH